MKAKSKTDFMSIQTVLKMLWHRAWVIVICILVGGGVAFSATSYLISPRYTSRISLYVNNDVNRTETALNINDINVSQKLVATYIEILRSDKVLNNVIDTLKLPYSPSQLKGMISASAINSTEIFEVKVTTENPEESALIANTLAEIAPEEIVRVVKAGGVQLIDKAVPIYTPVSPNIRLNTLMGGMLGLILAVAVIVLLEMADNRVKSADDLHKYYDLPVLGSIPDILQFVK